MVQIGAITVGQSPRVDITDDLKGIFGSGVTLLEEGTLDGLTKGEIAAFKPDEGDYILVSRLRDGSQVMFAEKYILPRLQECIDHLQAKGVGLILFFCTGEFPPFRSNVPLIFPNRILNAVVPALASNILVLTPDQSQQAQSLSKWETLVAKAQVVSASPYGPWEALEQAAVRLGQLDGELVVLDCMGYTVKMKKMVEKISGKRVILPRTVLARIAMELVGE